MSDSGKLYVVATPIGNLSDASPRMREVLASVDRIACEDTRHARRLLSRFGIRGQLISLHEHNENARVEGLIEALRGGESLALISDAGTPLLSDPGFPLVRAAVAAGIDLCPIPGPNAAIAALSVSGLPPEPFRFLGFPPRQTTARARYFQSLSAATETLIFYESVHRLAGSLEAMSKAFGPDRPAFLGREISKLHEQLRHGTLSELLAWARQSSQARKGELVLIVGGAAADSADPEQSEVDAWLRALSGRLPPREAARVAAEVSGLPRNRLYKRLLAIQSDSDGSSGEKGN
ncbi:16S rRNA (cytidine(1402)-2'-O)-methyltransferase [Natronospira sp.]|uniref:16S rRNA (cytidine(1402)-2'-O)-methyltransferase n=1 Tax=Natronospira sp. TaxID=2024970 RepID=UPI0038734BCD